MKYQLIISSKCKPDCPNRYVVGNQLCQICDDVNDAYTAAAHFNKLTAGCNCQCEVVEVDDAK